MAKEIELKLAIPSQAADLLKQHRVLQHASSYDSKELRNIYFDTENLDLNRAKVALRVRKSGNNYIQTLKTSGSGSGGLHKRGEWEWPVSGSELELDKITPDLWPSPLNAEILKHALKPVFETNFSRKTWHLNVSHQDIQAEIELVLDNGIATANGQQDPISEIELELQSGDPDMLFKVAHDLSDEVPLMISNVSKAQRGFRLYSPEHAGTWAPRVPPFENYSGLIKAAQIELDSFIAARDRLAFDRNWLNLEALYESLLQLRWCCFHLNRMTTPKHLKAPSYLTYKLRMLSYSLEHLVNLYRQNQSWQRLPNCPDALQKQANFTLLNSQYHTITSEAWTGQSLLEVMQWLYILDKEGDKKAFTHSEDIFQALLRCVQLPSHPTDKLFWLRQAAPLLHLIRWVNYQFPQPGLGIKHLNHEANQLVDLISELGGLMSEELSLKSLAEENVLNDPALLERNQKDQYQKVLELGRIGLSFNSLRQNLLSH